MKKILFISWISVLAFTAAAQRVGIGTTAPKALLHVQDSNVVFTGLGAIPGNIGLPPISGPGARFMWYANISALRSGRVTGNQWDMDSVGRHSVAMGHNPLATGASSVSIGSGTEARGGASVALGNGAKATGTWGVALGSNTMASETWSTAMGVATTASGSGSTAIGNHTVASGDNSTAMGYETIAGGERSTSMGSRTDAGSYASTTMGYGTIARGYACTAVGYYNTSITIDIQPSITSTSPLFIVGNGDGNFERKNAMVVLKNGNVGIGSNNPAGNLTINDNTDDPIIQFQKIGHDVGFLQTAGNNIRLGTNSDNDLGNVVLRANGADRFTIMPNGNATLSGTLTQNSDARFKTNIVPVQHALDKIKALTGYQYNWKPGLKRDSSLQIGLIAQNVETVLPQLVATDAEGNKSVAYQNMVSVLIEAVKEQQQMIEEMKKKIDQLEKDK